MFPLDAPLALDALHPPLALRALGAAQSFRALGPLGTGETHRPFRATGAGFPLLPLRSLGPPDALGRRGGGIALQAPGQDACAV